VTRDRAFYTVVVNEFWIRLKVRRNGECSLKDAILMVLLQWIGAGQTCSPAKMHFRSLRAFRYDLVVFTDPFCYCHVFYVTMCGPDVAESI